MNKLGEAPRTSAVSLGQSSPPGRGMTPTVDWFLLLAPGLIWGASFLFIAQGLDAIGPNGLTFTRILVGFAILAFFPAARSPVPPSAWPAIALLGVIWMAFPLSLFPFAEQRVSSALTGVLNGANPIFTAIVAAVLAQSLPSRAVVAGLALACSEPCSSPGRR